MYNRKGNSKERRKGFAFFADLTTAFDIINRKKLWSMLREKGINNHLVNRNEEIYKEIINKVLYRRETFKRFLDGIWSKGRMPA